jgi:hypothetical protein
VVLILLFSVLGVVTAPQFGRSASLNREELCRKNRREVQQAVEVYVRSRGGYPARLKDVLDSSSLFPAGEPECPLGGRYFMTSDHEVLCTHEPH